MNGNPLDRISKPRDRRLEVQNSQMDRHCEGNPVAGIEALVWRQEVDFRRAPVLIRLFLEPAELP